MTRPGRRHPRATILVAVIAALVMLQILVVALTLAGPRDHDLTLRRVQSARAFYAAEAAMNMALRELCLGTDEDADTVVGGIASGTPSQPRAIGDLAAASVSVATEQEVTVCVAQGRSGASMHRIRCELD